MFYAEKAMHEAFRRTKLFFFKPFNLNRWLKLSFVGILGGIQAGSAVGGSGLNGNNGGSYNGGSNSGTGYNGGSKTGGGGGGTSNFLEDLRKNTQDIGKFYKDHTILIYTLIGLVALILTTISLIFSYIRSNMFFVFMESLMERNVSIMKSFSNNKGKGFSLFLFKLVTGIVFCIVSVVIFIPLILHLWHVVSNPKEALAIWTIVPNFILSFIVFFIFLFVYYFIFSLVYDFACPISYSKDTGIMEALSLLTRLIMNYPGQFGMYYVLKIAFAIASGIISFILLIISLLVFAIIYIPLIAIAVAISVGIVFAFMKDIILGFIAGVVGIILIICLIMAIEYIFTCPTVPVHGFFRFYALCFLEMFPEVGLNFSEAYTEGIVTSDSL